MDELRTLHDVIDDLARRGDAEALVSLTEEGEESWSYATLSEHVEELARGIRKRGIEPGSRIAMYAEPRLEWVAAALAVVRSGCVIVPIDVQMGEKDRDHILSDSGTRMVCTTTDQLDALPEDPQRSTLLLDAGPGDERSWLHWKQADGELERTGSPEDNAALFYTSGTTGLPKGVPLTHHNISFELNALIEANLVRRTDRILLPLPLHHVYPVVIGILAPLTLEVPIIFPESITGPEIVRALREARATVVLGVPRLYRALKTGIDSRIASLPMGLSVLARGGLALCRSARRHLGLYLGKWLLRPLHQQFGPDLRMLVSGGSALEPDLAHSLESFGWMVATGYGLTETSPILTINRPGEGRLETAGRALPGVELKIDPSKDSISAPDPDGSPRRGEVLARGPNVFGGYWNLPEKTKEVLDDDGWFHTGDLGYFDDDEFLYLQGRVSTMIVTESGENVQPDQVEAIYEQSPLIEEIGVLENDGRLVGVVVPDLDAIREHGEGSVETAVQQAILKQSREMPTYQRLSDVVLTRESLPKTRLGDLRRHLLPERYEQARQKTEQTGDGAAEPISIEQMSESDRELVRTPPADRVWQTLAERYDDRPLRPESSLQVDLGVDSLEWVNLSLELGQKAGVTIDEDMIAEIDTVRDLLQMVVKRSEQTPMEDRGGASPLEDPESVLDEDQKKWLSPIPPALRPLRPVLFGLNRMLVRGTLSVEVEIRSEWPTEPVVLAPNHLSFVDPFLLAAVLPYEFMKRTYWAAWTGQAFNNPLKRLVSRLAQAVPIDPARAMISSLAFGAAVLKREHNLIWFPEGRRSPTGDLQSFQPGLGILLDHFSVPVIPTRIHGTFDVLPPGRAVPRPGTVRVVFGEPTDPGRWKSEDSQTPPEQQIMDGLRREIEALDPGS